MSDGSCARSSARLRGARLPRLAALPFASGPLAMMLALEAGVLALLRSLPGIVGLLPSLDVTALEMTPWVSRPEFALVPGGPRVGAGPRVGLVADAPLFEAVFVPVCVLPRVEPPLFAGVAAACTPVWLARSLSLLSAAPCVALLAWFRRLVGVTVGASESVGSRATMLGRVREPVLLAVWLEPLLATAPFALFAFELLAPGPVPVLPSGRVELLESVDGVLLAT